MINVGDEVRVYTQNGSRLVDSGTGLVEQMTAMLVVRNLHGGIKYRFKMEDVILEKLSHSVHASNMKHGR